MWCQLIPRPISILFAGLGCIPALFPVMLYGQATYTGKLLKHEVTIVYSTWACTDNAYVKQTLDAADTSKPIAIQLPSDATSCLKGSWPNSPFTGTLTLSVPSTLPASTSPATIPSAVDFSASVSGEWKTVYPQTNDGFEATALVSSDRDSCPTSQDVKLPPLSRPATYSLSNFTAKCSKRWLNDNGTVNGVRQANTFMMFDLRAGPFDAREGRIVWPNSRVGISIFSYYTYNSGPSISLDKNSLSFETTPTNNTPPAQTLTLTNSGGAALTWQAATTTDPAGNWLSVSPASNTLNVGQSTPLSISVNATSLGLGTYSGTITVSSPNAINSPQRATVQLAKSLGTLISLSTTSLSFLADETGNPPPKTVNVSNSGSGTLSWQAGASTTTGGNWLSFNPSSGSLNAGQSSVMTVSVNAIGLSNGIYQGAITVTSPSAANSPQKIEVQLFRSAEKDTVILLDETPKDGTTIEPGTDQGFSGWVTYTLMSRNNGELTLRVFNQDDVLQGTPVSRSVKKSDGTNGTFMEIPKFTIGLTTTRLKLKAILLDDQSNRLTESNTVSYPVQTKTKGKISKIEAYYVKPQDNSEPAFLSNLWGGHYAAYPWVREGFTPCVFVEYDLAAASGGGRLKLVLTEERADGIQLREPAILDNIRVGAGSNKKEVLQVSRSTYVPRDVDYWVLRAVLEPDDGGEQIVSDPVKIEIMRVNVIPGRYIPPNPAAITLTRGQKLHFRYELECNVAPWYDSMFLKASVGGVEVDTRAAAVGISRPIVEFDYTIPADSKVKELEVLFLLTEMIYTSPRAPGQTFSEAKVYKKLVEPVKLTAAVGMFVTGMGLIINTVQNSTEQVVNIIRSNTSLSSWGSSKPPSDPGLKQDSPAPPRAEAPDGSTTFKDFIGINGVWQIDPPIPASASTPFGDKLFSADLTFSYDAKDLPDDPNFKESQIKVVNYDPATGKLQSYTTAVDSAKKTATARVQGLGPFLSLGVVGPFSQTTLDFPILRSTGDLYTGLGSLNLGTGEASLTLTAYAGSGEPLSGAGVTNPATARLGASQQSPKLAPQFFNFSDRSNNGWVQVRSDKSNVVGFELLGSETLLDGVDAQPMHSPNLIFTDVECDSTYSTELHIANVSNFQTNVTLALQTNAPQALETVELSLAPKEKFTGKVQDVFSTIQKPFLGYVIVRADHELAAAELLISSASIAALNAQFLEAGSAAPSKLYSAQLASGGGAYYTRFNVVNPTSRTAVLTIRAVGENGANLATPVNITLSAGQQYRREVGQMFGLNPDVLTVGSLIIDSSITGIVGDVSFGDPSSKNVFRSSLPLDSAPSKFAAFAQVANGAGYFTGFAAFNPNSTASNVELKIYSTAGTLTGSSKFQIAANGRLSKLLPQVVPVSDRQVGGYFTLTSDQPLSSFAVFGTTSLSALSAVPAQGKDMSAGAAPPPPSFCGLFGDSFDSATLSGWSVANANSTWLVVNGKLQASNIASSGVAMIEHSLPAPNYFRLTTDVEVDGFNGTFYGFQPYSTTQIFTLNTVGGALKIDGLGVAVTDKGQVGFLAYDVEAERYILINLADSGPIGSLGLEWTSSGVSLLVNGAARQTIAASVFGATSLPPPSLDTLSLLATGSTTRARFDNVCERAP